MRHSLKSIIALLLCVVMLSSTILTSCDSGDSSGGGNQGTSQSTPSDNTGDNSSQNKPSDSKSDDGDSNDNNQTNNNGGDNEDTTILATGVTLNKTTLSLIKGGSETLTATVAPVDTTDKSLTWTSSNTSVATVVNGTVTAVGAGTATITVTTANGKTATCEVTVSVLASGVSLNKNNLSLIKGGSETLTATVAPADTTDKTLTWASSNTNVAIVTNGTVTAVGVGTATITVTTANGKTATCDVTVSVLASGVSLNKNNLSLIKGSSETLTAIFSPTDTTDKSIIWTSSDESVATVENGVVVAKAEGIAVIVATTSNGLIASCSVTVQNAEVKTEAISLNKTTVTMNTGDTDTLTVSFNPTNVTNKELTWSSSNENVIRVYDGVIIAVGSGSATVTATSENGKTASCAVTVSSDTGVTTGSIILDQSIINMQVGGFAQLTATVDVQGGMDYTVIWASSDPSVATVSNGFVMTYSSGSAVITAMVKGTTLSAICYVEVSAASSGGGSTVSAWKQQELLQDLPEPTFGTCTGVNFNGATYENVTRSDALEYVDSLRNKGYNIIATSNSAYVYAGSGSKGTKKVSIGWTLNGGYFSVLVQDSSYDGSSGNSGGSSSSAVMPSSVALDKQTATLEVGEYVVLTPTVSPSNTTDKRVGWSSSDPTVAYVKNGIVMAMGKGTATITVHTENGKTASCVVMVIKKAESIILDKTSATMNKGDTLSLNAIVLPTDVSDTSVSWTTSNENVVTVVDGVLTAVGAGTATITATEKYGKTATCTVTVVIPATGISLNTGTQNMAVGDTNTLVATVAPFDATDKSIVWHSSDEAVATVDENGKVTALTSGTAIITATASNGSVASCVVNVSSIGINLNHTELNVVIGYSKDLVVTITPDYTVNKAIFWSSSDPTVASVDSNGKVTAHKKGTAVITATHISSGTTAVCTVTVSTFELSFSTLNVNGTTTNDVFSNSTADFDFKNEVSIIGNATYVVSLDEYGTQTVITKKVPLAEGDNKFYLIIASGDEYITYTVNIRRRPMYSVIFEPNNGDVAKTVQVEEGQCVDVPTFTWLGYNSPAWDVDLTVPVTNSFTAKATWTVRDDMKKFEFVSNDTECEITGYTGSIYVSSPLYIPDCVTSISADFSEYTYLTQVHVGSIEQWCGITFSDETANPLYHAGDLYVNGEIVRDLVIPNSITKINDYAFFGCSVKNVTIPNSVINIGQYVFAGCVEMGSVKLGDNVQKIGNNAFQACRSLTSITVPQSVQEIQTDAFKDCVKLYEVYDLSTHLTVTVGETSNGSVAYYAKVVHTYATNESIILDSDGYKFYFDEAQNKYYLITYVGTATDLVFPESINGNTYHVLSEAFYNRTDITSIKIGNGVESIGSYAFWACTNITEISITGSDTQIGAGVFCMCSRLKTLTLSHLQYYLGYYFGASNIIENGGAVPSALSNVTVVSGALPTNAFCGCKYIKNVMIGKGVTSITISGFDGCTNLTNLNVDSTNAYYTSIDGVLYSKDRKTLILYPKGRADIVFTIPDNVSTIGEYAFEDCTNLTFIVLPDSITSIGSNAFSWCSCLKRKYYCGTVSEWATLNASINLGNTSLINATTYYYSELEPSEEGDFWYYDENNNIKTWNSGKENSASEGLEFALNADEQSYSVIGIGECIDTVVIIPDSYNGLPVTSIYEDAFYGCKNIIGITIPDSVTHIDDGAFSSCTGLASVTIGNGVTSIGEYAFQNCSSLIYNYYDNAYYIGNDSNPYVILMKAKSTDIDSCNIHENTKNIYQEAFENCINLKSITIPNSVLSMGGHAFYKCTSLTSVIIGNGIKYISSFTFSDCIELTRVIIGNGVTSIDKYAFDDSINLIQVENGISYVDKWVIDCDTSITTAILRSDTVGIAEDAFYDCTKLVSITIPDSVTSIDTCAFYGCTGLTSIKIPNSVTSIGEGAFSQCTGLTSVTIGESVTSIGYWAFYGCTNIQTATIPTITISYIPKTNLKTVIITGGTSIGDDAFEDCTSLTSVTIPNSVTSIGNGAFSGCTSLTSIAIPDSVISIGKNAFYYCRNLENIIVNTNNTTYQSIDGNLYSKDGKVLIQYAIGKTETNFVIPEVTTIIGDNAFEYCRLASITSSKCLTKIGAYAFRCSSLTNITIPNSVTSIGDYVFDNCYHLTSVTIGNGVASIGEYAFNYCKNLTTITIPDSLTSIGGGAFFNSPSIIYNNYDNAYYLGNDSNPYVILIEAKSTDITSCKIYEKTKIIYNSAFYGCTSLTSVTIPDSVTSIGNSAFGHCTGLTSITIPDGVTSIGNSAFSHCTGFTSITIPNSVTSIGSSAFRDCDSLTSITIPDSVTSIGDYAFRGCSSLTSITIPDSVTSIGKYAFYNCTNLTSVAIGNSVTSIGNYAFSGCTGLTSVYYGGTADTWEDISIGSSNTSLTNATRYYYSEEAPTDTTYNYWHYVDGVPTPWEKN